MIKLLSTLLISLAIVSVCLWSVGQLARANLYRPLRIIRIAAFLIFVLVWLLPMLGVS